MMHWYCDLGTRKLAAYLLVEIRPLSEEQA